MQKVGDIAGKRSKSYQRLHALSAIMRQILIAIDGNDYI